MTSRDGETGPEGDPDDRRAVVDLAQALMAEITRRLEDLAALAAERQLSTQPQPAIEQAVRSVLALVEGHRELLAWLETSGPGESRS
ncbi:MAG: hypothetical protein Q8R44_10825 [Novosphingobium sp.]|nr:hypothetical protein [Novosphingobium sp.]